jgi:hypothetical protein
MLNEDFSRFVIAEQEQKFGRQARRRREETEALAAPAESVVLRLCRVDDDPELESLAVLDGGARIVPGRYVLAEVNGRIVAGMPLSGGDIVADPFHHTANLLPLLQLRAQQLTQPHRSRLSFTLPWLAAIRH